MKLGLAIPLYDEEDCAEAVVTALHGALTAARAPFELALVNNGSTDGTGAVLNRLAVGLPGVKVLHLEHNAGYGGGVLVGLRSLRTPALGWCWGDGQVAPEVVVEAWRRLRAGDVDLVKARRVERQDGAQRAVVSRVYNGLMQRGFGLDITDTNGCPKLMTRAAWDALAPRSTDWFLDPEVMLRAAELGLRVAEVDAVMRPRAGGASKVSGQTVLEFARHLAAWKRGWRPGR